MSSSEEKLRPRAVAGELLGPGTLVGSYVVQGHEARAGFATVYRALDLASGEKVAVKVLHEQLARSPRSVERFRREYRALKTIRHPNVVEIRDYGHIDDGRPYFVMEWCDGATLQKLLESGPFTVQEAMPIIGQLVAALEAVHEIGVIHRDVKAANVVITPTTGEIPRLKLIDFGIVRPTDDALARRTSLTSTGDCMGTPHAMAPEQLYGGKLDVRTDVYAVGVLIYEMITGRSPFQSASLATLVDDHLHAPPPKVSDVVPVPARVDGVVRICMAKRAEHRFGSVREIFEALEGVEQGSVASARAAKFIANAVGVHIGVDFACSEDDATDDEFELMDDVLSRASAACVEAGLDIVVDSGNGMLATGSLAQLSHGATVVASSLEHRQHMLDFAREFEALVAGDIEGTRLRVRCVVHRANLEVDRTRPRVRYVGGDLLSVGQWSPDGESGVLATRSALDGLEDRYDSGPVAGSPEHVRLL